MKTVYIVEHGSYSDKYIVGVCSTEELAKKLAMLTSTQWESSEWTEFTIDKIPTCPERLLPFKVVMYYNGDTYDVGRRSIDIFKPSTEVYGKDNLMYFSMWAKDEKHAVKIANERRVRLIAQNIWLKHEIDKDALRQFRGEENEDLQDM